MNLRIALAAGGLTLGMALAFAPPVFATGDHHEEVDGCDHGATGKDCKPDPSENGKDCETHGNHGGVNEDHCAPVEPSSSTTTTTSSAVLERPSPETTVDPAAGPAGQVTPHLGCNDVNGFPYITNIDQGGCPGPSVADLNDAVAISLPRELPRTGANPVALILAGLTLIFAGSAIRHTIRER